MWNHFDLVTLTMITQVAYDMSRSVNDELQHNQDDFTNPSDDLRIRRVIATAVVFETIFLFHYIRILNQSLAVFITALVQIVIDLRWFIFVLVIMLSMFAQMFMAIIPGTQEGQTYASMNCGNQVTAAALLEECIRDADISSFKYFYRITYEMMLGDWDLDRGFSDGGVYPVFVLFTFFITIIMTNMLIAIASGSYENAKQKGPGLFRIMRIHYCSEVSLLELATCQGTKVVSALIITGTLFSIGVVRWLDRTTNKSGSFEHQYHLYLAVGVMAWYVFTAAGVLYYTATSSRMVKERQCHKFGFGVLLLYFRNVSRFIQFVGKRLIGTIESDDDENWDNDSGCFVSACSNNSK
uniref:Ion transport domain-containing protein n=1 Tax=Leptocylindrus danicus TaxID=163516 RepID=A0A7S2K8T3_9STRA|mmetsp:Transcript_19942/g.29686  ORF Transcript_19942/g.29686 Transcript_19942/m.29686 type:complete len:353 (+) Transcript_19942:759-1817(+)